MHRSPQPRDGLARYQSKLMQLFQDNIMLQAMKVAVGGESRVASRDDSADLEPP